MKLGPGVLQKPLLEGELKFPECKNSISHSTIMLIILTFVKFVFSFSFILVVHAASLIYTRSMMNVRGKARLNICLTFSVMT